MEAFHFVAYPSRKKKLLLYLYLVSLMEKICVTCISKTFLKQHSLGFRNETEIETWIQNTQNSHWNAFHSIPFQILVFSLSFLYILLLSSRLNRDYSFFFSIISKEENGCGELSSQYQFILTIITSNFNKFRCDILFPLIVKINHCMMMLWERYG